MGCFLIALGLLIGTVIAYPAIGIGIVAIIALGALGWGLSGRYERKKQEGFLQEYKARVRGDGDSNADHDDVGPGSAGATD